MKYIFSPAGREALHSALQSRPLLAFDFDGTLSPLTLNRTEATMRPRTRELLARVAERSRCAIITGRSRDDMRSRVSGIAFAEIVGNHGMEPSDDETQFETITQSWVPAIDEALRRISGAELENKRLSLSIHYSRANSPDLALRDILSVVQQLGDAALVVRGHRVVNVIPRGASLKSGAVRKLMAMLGVRTSIFFGDDWTDEEAFQSLSRSEAMTVRVGRLSQSSAQYYLRSQSEIDDLLEIIAADRAASLQDFKAAESNE